MRQTQAGTRSTAANPTVMASLRRAALVLLAVTAALSFATRPADAVVGGREVPQGQHQYMAALLRNGSQICGGTVVAPRRVVTAAHCVTSATGLSVRVGNVDYTRGRSIAVVGVARHGAYDPDTARNDVAVLYLASDAGVPAVTLAETRHDTFERHGTPARVVGWGSEMPVTGEVPSLGTRLKEADVGVVADNRCSTVADPATQVCAEAFFADSCHGDSGGPLIVFEGATAVQIGIVSYGYGCAVPTLPGVYSEVNASSIREFIRTHAGV